jgi:hypothetical protein
VLDRDQRRPPYREDRAQIDGSVAAGVRQPASNLSEDISYAGSRASSEPKGPIFSIARTSQTRSTRQTTTNRPKETIQLKRKSRLNQYFQLTALIQPNPLKAPIRESQSRGGNPVTTETSETQRFSRPWFSPLISTVVSPDWLLPSMRHHLLGGNETCLRSPNMRSNERRCLQLADSKWS